jgi:hypothetical protein
MENQKENKESEVKTGSKARKIILWFCALIMLGALFTLVLASIISIMVISREPIDNKNVFEPDMRLFMTLQKKLNPLQDKIFTCKPEDRYEITLSGAEVNFIVNNVKLMGAGGGALSALAGASNVKWPESLNIVFDDGWFNCEYSYKMPMGSPFGQFVNISGRVQPQMKDGIIDFYLEDIRTGTLNFPRDIVKDSISDVLNDKLKAVELFRSIVMDLYVNDAGMLTVKIRPYAIREYLTGRL